MPLIQERAAAGVFSREMDLSVFVEAFSPTVLGLVGTAQTGPVNVATLTTGVQQWLTTFGNPVSLGGYAALQFLRRATQLIYLRVAGSGAVQPESEAVPGEADGVASIVSTLGGPFAGLTASTAAVHSGSANQNFALNNETKASWTGGNGAGVVLATLQAITDGDLRLNLDGTTSTIAGIDFTGATNLADVAQVIQAAIATHAPFGAATATVTAPASGAVGFKITSDAYGASGVADADTVVGAGTNLYPLLGGSVGDVLVTGVNANDLLGIVEVLENPADTNTITIDLLAPGASPTSLTAAQVASLINAQLSYVTASTFVTGPDTRLRLTHDVPGLANTFQVQALAQGSAHTLLGLTAATYAGTNGTDRLVVTFVNAGASPDGTVIAVLGEDPTTAQAVDAVNAAIAYQLAGAGEAQSISTGAGQLLEIHTADGGAGSSITVTSASSDEVEDATEFPVDSAQSGTSAGADTLIFRERYVGNTSMSVRLFQGSAYVPVSNEVFRVKVYQGTVLVGDYDNLRKTAASEDEEAFLFENVIGTDDAPLDPFITVESISGGGIPVVTDTANGDLYELTTLAADPSGLTTVSTSDYIGLLTPTVTGLQIFRDAEQFQITLLSCAGVSTDAVHRELIDIAETRQDCLALIDPPQGLTVQQVADWHNALGAYAAGRTALNSSYAALYYPWVKVYDAIGDQDVWTAPSGHASAVIAYSHAISEPWFAPAGLKRGRVSVAKALERNVTDGDRAFLQGNLNRVNTFVNFARYGIVLFSENTLYRVSSALADIHVRFLFIIARTAIVRYLLNFNFDPHDSISWRLMENGINPFLAGIANSRGLTEFGVVINAQTNTPDYLERDEAHGIIYMKPTPTMKRILIDFVVVGQSVNISSLSDMLF